MTCDAIRAGNMICHDMERHMASMTYMTSLTSMTHDKYDKNDI